MNRFSFFVGLFLTASFLASGIGCDRSKSEAAKAAPPPMAVTAATPVRHDIIEWDVYSGRLAASDEVEVRARVSGFLEDALFEDGAIVKKDQPLFKIDAKPFKNALDAATAEVERVKAQYDFDLSEFKRIETLATTGAATSKELHDAELMLRRSTAAHMGALAVQKTATLNLGYTDVKAPIAGRIGRRLVSPGNLINGGAGQSTLLTTIVSTDPIHCYVEADERSVLKYQRLAREKRRESARDVKIPCWIGLANEEGFPHRGIVDFVNNSLDPTTGTMTARGVFTNPDGMLTPGLFARLRVAGSGRYSALVVPDQAVLNDQNLKFVFVIDEKNAARKQHVEVGPLYKGMRVITRGLEDNSRVVINGYARIREGVTLKPDVVAMPLPKDFHVDETAEPNGNGSQPVLKPTTTQPTAPATVGADKQPPQPASSNGEKSNTKEAPGTKDAPNAQDNTKVAPVDPAPAPQPAPASQPAPAPDAKPEGRQ